MRPMKGDVECVVILAPWELNREKLSRCQERMERAQEFARHHRKDPMLVEFFSTATGIKISHPMEFKDWLPLFCKMDLKKAFADLRLSWNHKVGLRLAVNKYGRRYPWLILLRLNTRRDGPNGLKFLLRWLWILDLLKAVEMKEL